MFCSLVSFRKCWTKDRQIDSTKYSITNVGSTTRKKGKMQDWILSDAQQWRAALCNKKNKYLARNLVMTRPHPNKKFSINQRSQTMVVCSFQVNFKCKQCVLHLPMNSDRSSPTLENYISFVQHFGPGTSLNL